MANLKFHVESKDRGFVLIALNPGWVNTDLAGKGACGYAPLQPEESMKQCLTFVKRGTIANGGRLWTLDGRPEAFAH